MREGQEKRIVRRRKRKKSEKVNKALPNPRAKQREEK